MQILGYSKIEKFKLKHSDSYIPLSKWVEIVEKAIWKTPLDLKASFGTVDIVSPCYCFDLGGNNYRLIAAIAFSEMTITIVHVFTHSEYDKWNKNK